MLKRTFLCLLLCLLLAVPALAEAADPQAEIDALNARIAELEATVADLQTRLAKYETVHDPDSDVITFNGGSVKLAEAQTAFDELAVLYEQFGMSREEYAENVISDVLANLAEDAVLAMKAQQLGVYENTPEQTAQAEAEAQESYEATLAYYIPYFENDSLSTEEIRAAAEQYLASEGLTYQLILGDIIDTQWRDRLFAAVTTDITVTYEDIRALYDSGLANAKELYADPETFEYDYSAGEIMFYHPEGYREVEYLLLPWSDEELAIEDESLRTDMLTRRYADLVGRAVSGEDLIVLAEEAMLFDYGMIPVNASSTLMPEGVRSKAMALEMNSTATVADDYGVWIVRYTADITPGEVPFEDLQPVLAESAAEGAKIEAYYTLVDQWMAEAEVVTHPEMLQ